MCVKNKNKKLSEDELIKKQYDEMTETPVNRLIASLALPTVISMLITTIYNAADTYFVSKINVSASGATGVVFSLMAVLQAFGFMFGHGSGSCISRRLGAGKVEEARRYSSTGFFLSIVSGTLILVFGLIWLTPLMRLLGSTDTILPYARDYGFWILLAGPAMTGSCVLNNILRYEGRASLAMIGLISGGILNMILDPVFIFLCKMGISGAGLSTAVSQYISLFLLFIMFKIGKTESRMEWKYITLKIPLILEIVRTGLPSLARQGLNSFSNMVLNLSAAVYGDPCIAAMSIVSKCSSFIFSIALGIGQGFQPVSAFNYGAKKFSRVKAGMRFTHVFATAIITVFSVICFAFAPQIVQFFRSDAEVVSIGTATLRYLCVSLVFMPTIMVGNMTFQSIGKTGRAFFLSCTQNGLFFIPLLLILPHFFGLRGLEFAQPCSNILAAAVTVPFLIQFVRKLPKDAEKSK